MTTPDYLQQVVVSGRRVRSSASTQGGIRRPSTSSVIWASLDVMTAIVAGLIALRIRGGSAPHPRGEILLRLTHSAPVASLTYLFVFAMYLIFISRVYGLYRSVQSRSGLNEQRLTIQAAGTAGLLLCGTLYLMQGYAISRIVVGLTVLLTMLMMMVRRALWRKVMERRYLQGLETRNVLIVGAGRVAHALRNHLESLRHMGFRFKGFIALDPKDTETGNADVVGDMRTILDTARALFVDEIYFSTPADKRIVIGLVEEARSAGIDVRVVPDLYDGLAWNAQVEYVGQFPTIPLHRREFPRGAFLMKRVLDVTLSVVALAVLLPFLVAIGIWIKLDSKGPMLYGAARIGRKGRKFTCYKFRTMVQDAEKKKLDLLEQNERASILFKMKNDPRVTRVGARLRRYSLDELPQFINVLAGDMSLVGPRPPIASEVEQYDLSHLKRLDVLPGMTGLWQVEARQDPSFDSYISLDTAYVENWNLMLDFRILARTIGVVLAGTGS